MTTSTSNQCQTEIIKIIMMDKKDPDWYNLAAKIIKINKETINQCDSNKWTALMYASCYSNMHCNTKIVLLLLGLLADTNMCNKLGQTALMISCINYDGSSNIETIKLLLAYGANPNIQDIFGCTALMYFLTNKPSIKYKNLLLNLINLSTKTLGVKNKFGQTAFDIYVSLNLNILNFDELTLLRYNIV